MVLCEYISSYWEGRVPCSEPIVEEEGAKFCSQHGCVFCRFTKKFEKKNDRGQPLCQEHFNLYQNSKEITNIGRKHDQLLQEIRETGVSSDFYRVIAGIYRRILENKEIYIVDKKKMVSRIYTNLGALTTFKNKTALLIDSCSLDENEKKEWSKIYSKVKWEDSSEEIFQREKKLLLDLTKKRRDAELKKEAEEKAKKEQEQRERERERERERQKSSYSIAEWWTRPTKTFSLS